MKKTRTSSRTESEKEQKLRSVETGKEAAENC